MFSAGNAPERHRVAKFRCEGEVVVDMYAGIGYFTLPYLIHAGAQLVHACEWNPNAVIALRYIFIIVSVTRNVFRISVWKSVGLRRMWKNPLYVMWHQ
jgi:tRNA wybutosine-synthesizing protein 2